MSTQAEVLDHIVKALQRRGRRFALVGGLAVSIRSEVRFTRDVDIAVVASSDAEVEALILELRGDGYTPVAIVEHESAKRIATVRLASKRGVVVDLLVASSGVEAEIVDRSTTVSFALVGLVPVAAPEELLAMKILSMTDARLQDRIDAVNLLAVPGLDLERVRSLLRLIRERGYARMQDLDAKLAAILAQSEGA